MRHNEKKSGSIFPRSSIRKIAAADLFLLQVTFSANVFSAGHFFCRSLLLQVISSAGHFFYRSLLLQVVAFLQIFWS